MAECVNERCELGMSGRWLESFNKNKCKNFVFILKLL